MPVLVLGPNAHALESIIGDDIEVIDDGRCTVDSLKSIQPSYIVSYGYRHILPAAVIAAARHRIINLHISYLPWNRGADPNLWSWLSNTPKGVSVHRLTEQVDRGDIIARELIDPGPDHTLRTSYADLQLHMVELFSRVWPGVASGSETSTAQSGTGSYHRSVDKERHLAAMPNGWDTRCSEVTEYGRRHGLWLSHSA